MVGGSGAGKSALLNALIGIRRGEGQVKLNGHDFYREHASFHLQLGYVPQSDILHASLTVEMALDYAASLRLPASLTPDECRSRVDAVLETVAMNTRAIRKTRISNLSKEQCKRVSIAAELLADPKLIYLDETTSDLDPGLEKKMMHTLRRIADEGRTVLLATDATNNILQTDQVAFLSEGKLVYFGPPAETLDFFEVAEFADIYEAVENKGEEWRKVFEEKKPGQYKKYVEDRQKPNAKVPKNSLVKNDFGILDYFRQLLLLTHRTFSVLTSNPTTLFPMLLLFPIAAILQLMIAKPDILTGNLVILADPVSAAKTMLDSYTPLLSTNIFLFLMGFEAVLTGLFLPINDLIHERSIFLRERMINLRVSSYLLSKVFIYSAFVALQALLYLIIISFGAALPAKGLYFSGPFELFVSLFLTMLTGVGFGLIISAVSKSREVAIYLLAITLFFQFLFAGVLFDLRGSTFEPLSYLSTTRWSSTALGVTIDMNRIAGGTILCNHVPENPLDVNSALKTVCFNSPAANQDVRLNYSNEQLTKSWRVLIEMTFLFLGVSWFLLRREDWI